MPVPPDLITALQDRYRIDREIGAGGMAVVYLAHDLENQRPVAIKVLRPEFSAVLGDRFLREIAVTGALQHPHILPLFASGRVDEQLYYVMPFVEGESLRSRLDRERQLPLATVLQISRDVAAALDYAHRHGVVHRDIKPENILLTGDEALVADFGIALAIGDSGRTRLTETGLRIGTPTYMSPEQAAGEREADGRSDIYALGCVVYEMYAGEPPFSGPSAQAIMAKRQFQTPAPLSLVRDQLPPAVEQAVMKALARAPVDRFGTAAEFVTAMSSTAVSGSAAGGIVARLRSRRGLVFGAIAIVLLVAAWILVARAPPRPLDPDLVAIAPFTVHGAELDTWHEGLVEYLSRSLDGAGALRTVSPSLYLRRWSGTSDVASARALGIRTGARLVVFGSLLRGGLDSVRLSVSLLDLASSAAPMTAEVSGQMGGIDHLADSAAVALLEALGQTRPVGAVRTGGFGQAPLVALKEYLQGERMYRRNQWDSALVHYNRAVELDSSFALASFRMSQVLWWNPRTALNYQSPEVFATRAGALNRGLNLRDSLLIASSVGDSDYHHVLATAQEATRRYPADPEAWQVLAEACYHAAPPPLKPAECLAEFDRAIALDSGFVPAYRHVFQLASMVGGGDLARRYARAFTSLEPAQAEDDELRMAARLVESNGQSLGGDSVLVAGLSAGQLFNVGMEHLGALPDSAETAIRVLRILAGGGHTTAGAAEWVGDSLMWPQYLAKALAFRGHLREAVQTYPGRPHRSGPEPWYAGWSDPSSQLALLGAVPEDSAAARFQRGAIPGKPFTEAGLAWWLARGDTNRLLRYVSAPNRVTTRDRDPTKRLIGQYQESTARAFIALIRRDSTAALRALAALPDSLCILTSCYFQKLTQARLLVAQGNDSAAAGIYDRWRFATNGSGPFWVIATLEQGELEERRGKREAAIKAYQYVLDAWRHADPELQRYTTRARDGLRRLTGEK